MKGYIFFIKKKKMKKIVIIGAGWYGMYIAFKLQTNKNISLITVIEKGSEIFPYGNASLNNQCRLHQGFHYPRSYDTRKLCREGFTKFMKEFPDLSFDIDNNWYVISNDSVIDFDTYCGIFEYENCNFDKVQTIGINNIQKGTAICVSERFICPEKARTFFERNVKNVKYLFNHTVDCIDCEKQIVYCDNKFEVQFDYCFDCTNFRINNIISQDLTIQKLNVIHEQTITLLYRKQTDVSFGALTVMDGPFFSIFPYNTEENIYTLTHVVYTANNDMECDIKIVKNKMEHCVCDYYPNFLNDFAYIGFFQSPKTKPVSKSDSRKLLQIHVSNNVEQISCGKITGIFQLKLPNF